MAKLNRPKLLVTADTEHLPQIQEQFREFADVSFRPGLSDAELLTEIPACHGIVTNIQQLLTRQVLDAAVNLKLVATPSTGTDHIDLACCREKGIAVQSLKTEYDTLKDITSTAELAFLLMLSVLRRLPAAFDSVRAGHWQRTDFRGREADGRILGIIGYGRLGEIFSRLARGFGMKILACDPFKTITDAWVEQLCLDELLQRAEIITLHVHLSPETEGMIGRREFELMRTGTYLVNTSRGKLIDEKAFLEALESGKLTGAGIDVLAQELNGSIANDPLVEYARTHNNLVITPHVGGVTSDAQFKAYIKVVDKVKNFFAGKHP